MIQDFENTAYATDSSITEKTLLMDDSAELTQSEESGTKRARQVFADKREGSLFFKENGIA
jgi:hypothetical protein